MVDSEIKCPYLKAPEVKEETPKVVPIPNNEFSEGAIQIGNFKMSGIRTYSIILLIMLTYCYVVIKSPEGVDGLRDLALMAAGFLFGAKVLNK